MNRAAGIDPPFGEKLFRLRVPLHSLEPQLPQLPELEPVVMNAHHRAQTPGLRVEAGMLEEASQEIRSVIGPHIEPHEAVGRMAQARFEEVPVKREERQTFQSVQEWNDVRVLEAGSAKVVSDAAEGNPPSPKLGQLILGEILVQQVQATANSTEPGSAARCFPADGDSQALCARRTASATAASGRRPLQRWLQMKSQERPSATSSKTCQTMMRVPLKVGLPWQISGSATMYRPSSMRPAFCCLALLMAAIYACGPGAARRFLPGTCLGLFLFVANSLSVQDFSIDRHTLAGGGTSAGGVFTLSGMLGQADAGGPLTIGTFSVTGGFWSLLSVVLTVGAPLLSVTLTTTNTAIVSRPRPPTAGLCNRTRAWHDQLEGATGEHHRRWHVQIHR